MKPTTDLKTEHPATRTEPVFLENINVKLILVVSLLFSTMATAVWGTNLYRDMDYRTTSIERDVTTFTVAITSISEKLNQLDKISDLEREVIRMNDAFRLEIASVKVDQLRIESEISFNTLDQWKRKNQLTWCRETELANEGWKCGYVDPPPIRPASIKSSE
jgi:hypothetical protein